jgi:FAD/FMN-containing dehydrogenase/Fe-S oxidoreductase
VSAIPGPAPAAAPIAFHPRTGDSRLARRLRSEVDGEVLFDRASRGRYATDASIYQIEPVGVVVPRTDTAARIALQVALEEGIPVLPRGAGSSQCGQTVGAALVIDHSKFLNEMVDFDPAQRRCVVQPGMVLDRLNALLRPEGLWFPVDVSTSAQATLGGMAGNNSCGSRSIRYGNMVHNVLGIDAVLADGLRCHFGPAREMLGHSGRALVEAVWAIARREAAEIALRWPKVLRRVQGYNLDMVLPADAPGALSEGANLAHLLVGSEGTLAYSERLHLKLSPLPAHKSLGVVHFADFHAAMALTQHIVRLDPDAVELVDLTMIRLAREIPAYRAVLDQHVRGEPAAVLLVEFAGEEKAETERRLQRLGELMADLGQPGSVVGLTDAAQQRALWEVRKAGLNIMMSMKGEGKPVSFIEDCAVPLEHLAEYTARLTEVFERHGTHGTWYAHASVGTLHVRPILNMKTDGASKMRAIAEEACALVRQFKGAYSGEHGDGLVRSEWIEPILGARLTAALAEVKALFDPRGLMNPGKIVRAPRQDDRSLFRYKPGYRTEPLATVLDWSAHGGFAGAVEMCNNNGHCRKFDAGTMCPSFRVTGNERDLTRGRANTLRLALSGQLGPEAFTGERMADAMSLCVGCKGCRRECPTGVDMAKMKIEFLHHHHARHGRRLRERLIGGLPRYAPLAVRLRGLLNARDRIPGLARMSQALLGLSARRRLPQWRADPFDEARDILPPQGAVRDEVVLFVDTFTRYFEPENARDACRVLAAAGVRVHPLRLAGERAVCCGRTGLATGDVAAARAEATRLMRALEPALARGLPILGLEPSCLFTLVDEFGSLQIPGAAALEGRVQQLADYLVRAVRSGRLVLPLGPLPEPRVLVHGHCHQKAFGALTPVLDLLRLVPGLEVRPIESSCCGMAGAFGYEAEHADVSLAMAEAALLPAVRGADEHTLIVADGTSCRHQIAEGAGREALHAVRVLARALRPECPDPAAGGSRRSGP